MTTVAEPILLQHGHFHARVLADSLSPDGVRLTTMEIQYPHAHHKDMLRHGLLRRSVMSFRAMPPEKLRAMRSDEGCYIPEVFTTRRPGMSGGEPLPGEVQRAARTAWLAAKDHAWRVVDQLIEYGVAKEQTNTLIQDYCWIREIVTATEWDNFLALRLDLKDDGTPMARPEVFRIASLMGGVLAASEPQQLDYGQYHLPLVTPDELTWLCELRNARGIDDQATKVDAYLQQLKMAAARRCARISFDRHLDGETLEVSVQKAHELLSHGHMSPFEHVGRPVTVLDNQHLVTSQRRANHLTGHMRGWVPMRYEFLHHDRYDLIKRDRGDADHWQDQIAHFDLTP